jgi:hypothetical protein
VLPIGNNLNNNLDKSKIKIQNLKVKNFNEIKNKIMKKTQTFEKIEVLNKKEIEVEKNDNKEKNKIGVLYEMEKKTLIIQKIFRGYLARKKYEKNLSNLKENNNKNEVFNKITKNNLEVKKNNFLNFDNSSSFRSEVSQVSINSKDLLSDEESEDLKESDLPSDLD